MSNEKPAITLNDHFFLQAASCPLKIPFLQSDSNLSGSRPVYRQRNKLHLRDAVSLRFHNCRQTSDNVFDALRETNEWLKEDAVAVCGAVVAAGNKITRIPILYKHKEEFTIIQIHGKLRKESERKFIDTPAKKRSTTMDLLKAAYRKEVLIQAFPGSEVHSHFYYPQKNFRASMNGLHTFNKSADLALETFQENFDSLFLLVDATAGVEQVRNQIPDGIVHEKFAGLSVGDAIDDIANLAGSLEKIKGIKRHSGCNYCEYRHSGHSEKGCWETNFKDSENRYSNAHTFDLIGYGNQELVESGHYYQEQVKIDDGLNSFTLIESYGGPKFTIQQRRNLQMLSARQEEVPLVWIKKGAYCLKELEFPLHFMDFEAATYAIPMKRGSVPYNPMYFQFSCHTLNKDRSITHTEWLQQGREVDNIHSLFVEKLSRIPDILRGTIIQFSPFEKQGMNRIMNEFKQNSMIYKHQIDRLNAILTGAEMKGAKRFVDLSEIVKSYYYNSLMSGSLGLKDLLNTLLSIETMYTDALQAFLRREQEKPSAIFPKGSNPYIDIQENNSSILDGSAAMHAWIAQKNGLLSASEEQTIPDILKKYCRIDSLAMVYMYVHLIQFFKSDESCDIVIPHPEYP